MQNAPLRGQKNKLLVKGTAPSTGPSPVLEGNRPQIAYPTSKTLRRLCSAGAFKIRDEKL